MGYIMVKDPASFQTPQKLLVLANKINKALIKKTAKGTTSCELVMDEDDDAHISLTIFNEDGSDNTSLYIFDWQSDEKAKEPCEFFILYLKGKKTFSEMKAFARRF